MLRCPYFSQSSTMSKRNIALFMPAPAEMPNGPTRHRFHTPSLATQIPHRVAPKLEIPSTKKPAQRMLERVC
ncbi:hypothetical protein [Rubritalea tangerina]|uniref:hypothetical protein n=1 Tax=Rubritalea tangerina TaxID=430798 RepID=UPI003610DF8A